MELYGLLTGVPAQRKLHGKDLNLLSNRECQSVRKRKKKLSVMSLSSAIQPHVTMGIDRRSANLS